MRESVKWVVGDVVELPLTHAEEIVIESGIVWDIRHYKPIDVVRGAKVAKRCILIPRGISG
jgi:hypothetical protein